MGTFGQSQPAKDTIRFGFAGLVTNGIAVVCSARSSSFKREGTTTLQVMLGEVQSPPSTTSDRCLACFRTSLRAAREAVNDKGSRTYLAILDTIQGEYMRAARETIRSFSILDQVVEDIQAECSSAIELLKASQHLEGISPRILDRITSTGGL